jgi:hypothetical protein
MKKLLVSLIATLLLFVAYKVNSEPETLIGFINMIFILLMYVAFMCVTLFTDAFETKK